MKEMKSLVAVRERERERESYSLRKENKGITLIALVITIIVLLILAGVTIAMLTGENGILTQSSKATVSQVEANVDERVRLAVQGCKIAIANETARDQSWSAVTDGIKPSDNKLDRASASGLTDETTNGVILASIAEDLRDTGYFISATTPTGEGTTATRDMVIEYSGDDYKKATNNSNAKIEYTLNITQHEVKIAYSQIGSSESSQGGGDSQDGDDSQGSGTGGSGGESSTGISGLTDTAGNTITASSLTTVGQDFKIRNETFRVINPNKDGKVVAMPYNNITLASTPVQNSSAGTTKFVNSSSEVTWNAGDDIDMENTNNLVQTYINAYSATLPTGVTARIARYSEVENLTNAQRAPGGTGAYWLGSAYSDGKFQVYFVTRARWH